MKKLLVSLAMVIFMVVGCGGGGDSSSGTGGPPTVGTPPTINSYQLYQVDKECAEQYGDDLIAIYNNCSTLIEKQDVYELFLNDLVLMEVEIEDPDLDLASGTLEQYLKEGDVYNLYYGPTVIELPAQNNEIEMYLISLEISGPVGEWRDDLWVTDEEANDSDVVSIYAMVEEEYISTQCSDGIDNDGDGLIDLDDPSCVNVDDNDEYNEPEPDVTPPEIGGTWLPYSVSLGNPDPTTPSSNFGISIRASDSGTGIASIEASIVRCDDDYLATESLDGERHGLYTLELDGELVEGDFFDGKFRLYAKVVDCYDGYLPTGKYYLDYVRVCDNTGNCTTINPYIEMRARTWSGGCPYDWDTCDGPPTEEYLIEYWPNCSTDTWICN